MLKLNASFSKKVPAEQEYSSKGYSATIEVELPDGLSQEQLQERIHNTFALVEASVETELNGSVNAGSVDTIPMTPARAAADPANKAAEWIAGWRMNGEYAKTDEAMEQMFLPEIEIKAESEDEDDRNIIPIDFFSEPWGYLLSTVVGVLLFLDS